MVEVVVTYLSSYFVIVSAACLLGFAIWTGLSLIGYTIRGTVNNFTS